MTRETKTLNLRLRDLDSMRERVLRWDLAPKGHKVVE